MWAELVFQVRDFRFESFDLFVSFGEPFAGGSQTFHFHLLLAFRSAAAGVARLCRLAFAILRGEFLSLDRREHLLARAGRGAQATRARNPS